MMKSKSLLQRLKPLLTSRLYRLNNLFWSWSHKIHLQQENVSGTLAVKYLLNIQSAEYLQFKYLVTVNNSCQKKHINMPRELIPNFLNCIYVNKARFNMCCVVPGEYISMFYVMVVQNSWNILKTLFNLKTYFKYRQMEILWDSSTQQSASPHNNLQMYQSLTLFSWDQPTNFHLTEFSTKFP